MSTFTIVWDTAEARALLADALSRGVRLRPVMLEIGYELVRSTQDRIDDERDPDGNAWVELQEETLARKRTTKKLVERGYLRGGVAVLGADNDFVEVGADREYAAIQQLGGTPDMAPGPAAIPARPYLGVSPEDVRLIESIVGDFLDGR